MDGDLPPDARGGVFETMLVIAGRPIELDAHMARLERSVERLFASGAPADALGLTLEAAAPLEMGRLRVTVRPGAGGALMAETSSATVDPADVFPTWDRAVALVSHRVQGGIGAHKWADRRALQRLEASVPPGALPLILDGDGEVLEASRANVFVVEDDALLTPPADGRILPGVARATALAVARSLGVPAAEESVTIERIVSAGEAFVTGSVRGVEPVRSVDGATLARSGPLVAELSEGMRRSWLAGGAPGTAGTRRS